MGKKKSFGFIKKYVEKLPPVTLKKGWIPVSERLPEEYKEVIVTDIETSDTYVSRYIGNEHWECDNGLFKNRIIAWQPKPQPYKAEIKSEREEAEYDKKRLMNKIIELNIRLENAIDVVRGIKSDLAELRESGWND